MKIKDIRDKSEKELDRMLGESREKLRDLRFKLAARQLTDVREIRELRQVVSRILTVKRAAMKK